MLLIDVYVFHSVLDRFSIPLANLDKTHPVPTTPFFNTAV